MSMRTIIIDNYDSFTYNLAHLVRSLGTDADVVRNDRFHMEDLQDYDKIIISPGPGIPSEAGLVMDVIHEYAPEKSILGVCLGEQAIGEAFGAKLTNLSKVFHGVQTPVRIFHDKDKGLFKGLPDWIPAGRYHSWVVDRDAFPSCLEVTAISEEDFIMALRHKDYDVQGIQFHPESILTPDGETIIRNFLNG